MIHMEAEEISYRNLCYFFEKEIKHVYITHRRDKLTSLETRKLLRSNILIKKRSSWTTYYMLSARTKECLNIE